ncbi:hypothetical protein B9Z55_008656 [Caenorhabditis nigoni]|uniref:Uncharacterized protein n=1 Tax=Caenorhabditis nigoni TaxID=1611254 RepID=A0A2G5UNI1_9PELO|nr:hypothetical protein B9Z55_008656 [Caenorhabditis nigoni]
MQFVALFAFVIAAAWADPPDRYSRSLISDSVRVKRGNNDDPFSLLHSRITSLSRVVTGVSLVTHSYLYKRVDLLYFFCSFFPEVF